MKCELYNDSMQNWKKYPIKFYTPRFSAGHKTEDEDIKKIKIVEEE